MRNFKSKPTPNPYLDPPSPSASDGLSKGDRRNFIRKKEDFVCENCGYKVVGNGYTDHCPKCLWGKHVDEEIPGDRASDCGGLMKIVEVTYLSGKFKIHYRCSKCRHEFWVGAAEDDNREELIELMRK